MCTHISIHIHPCMYIHPHMCKHLNDGRVCSCNQFFPPYVTGSLVSYNPEEARRILKSALARLIHFCDLLLRYVARD